MNSTVYAPTHEDGYEPQGLLLLERMNLYAAKIAVVHDRFKVDWPHSFRKMG